MTISTTKSWDSKRTQETREVEKLLREHFEQVDSYRYNSASIRLRVIDSRFEGMSRERRDSLVEEQLDKLPLETQQDIVTLFAFSPSELKETPKTFREFMLNREFEEWSPSGL